MSVFITQRQRNPAASTQPGMGFQYWLWWYDDESQTYIDFLSSEFMEVTEEMIDAVYTSLWEGGENA